jgi:hypothetical protein
LENSILFTETQRCRQWWLWLILVLLNGANTWFLLKKYVYKKPFPDTIYHSYSGGEVGSLITLLVTVFILMMKLETKIKSNQIEVRFFPFHLSFKQFQSNTIESAFVRTYKPLAEYGGWGLRIEFIGRGKAFNISGNKGIQLVFKDGRKLLIGTQKPEEANEVLQKAGYLKAEKY